MHTNRAAPFPLNGQRFAHSYPFDQYLLLVGIDDLDGFVHSLGIHDAQYRPKDLVPAIRTCSNRYKEANSLVCVHVRRDLDNCWSDKVSIRVLGYLAAPTIEKDLASLALD